MKTYEVTVRAEITKTYTIEAENKQSAADQANELFSILEDGTPETYSQDTLDCEEVR